MNRGQRRSIERSKLVVPSDLRFSTTCFLLAQSVFLLISTQNALAIAVCIATLAIAGVGCWRGRWLAPLPQGLTLIAFTGLVIIGAIVSQNLRPSSMRDIYLIVALYMLAVQATEVIRTPPRPTTSNYVPGLGCVTMVLVFLSFDGSLAQSLSGWFSFGFMVLLLFVLRPDLFHLLVRRQHRGRRKALTLLLVSGAALSCGALFQRDLDARLKDLQLQFPSLQNTRAPSSFGMAGAAFVEHVNLHSITAAQKKDPNNAVFTVESRTTPGYMRTLAFDQFDGWQWAKRPRRRRGALRSIRPSLRYPRELDVKTTLETEGRVFQLQRKTTSPYQSFHVTVPGGRGKLSPLPGNTTFIRADTPSISADMHGVVTSGLNLVHDYLAFSSPEQPYQESEEYLAGLLQLPPREAKRLRELSSALLGDVQSVPQRAATIEAYFHDNFSYSLDFDPDGDRSARFSISEFVESHPPGHCEYFATATAMLLRAQKVPCRLATGYLVYELSDSQDYFVARNRNAHAWVEAYDAASGRWILVESTPGIKEYVDQFNDQVLDDDQQLASSSQNSGSAASLSLAAILVGVADFFSNARVWILPFPLFVAFYLYRRLNRERKRLKSEHPGSRYLRRADRLAMQFGYHRAGSETCHQFARRLSVAGTEVRQLAVWYENYGDQRYRKDGYERITPPPRKSALRKKRDHNNSQLA